MKAGQRKQRLVAEINITPFTDVILVLLIIFMIATPLIFQSGIKVKLPQASQARPLNEQQQAYVSVTNESLIYLGNELVTKKELKEKMKSMFVSNPELKVTLRSDKLVRFKDIVSILDTFNDIGVKNLNIAATNEE